MHPLPLPFNSVDEWLADDLCHSGLFSTSYSSDYSSDYKPQDLQTLLLPVSPPLTASPLNPAHTLEPEPTRAPLFPDILPRPRVLMPRTSVHAIAPRPTSMPLQIKKREVEDKEDDDVSVKRQKNTDAARRSRLKRLKKMECLEERVNALEGENTRLTTRIAVLESEKAGLQSKDKGLEDRVKVLEQQLAEAHRVLTTR
ncbi:hypothetical protein BDF14DRAFT_1727090 [Spinellus fusiger]|nr:hypothetical protein BDF14DRAFT_1727090 [Spinellus fusiger]